MGRNSGGNNTGAGPGDLGEGDSGYRGSITNVQSLVHMKDKQLYKETKQAISRYHAVMGVRERNVKLADMDKSVMGVQASVGGQSAPFISTRNITTKALESLKKTFKSNTKADGRRKQIGQPPTLRHTSLLTPHGIVR